VYQLHDEEVDIAAATTDTASDTNTTTSSMFHIGVRAYYTAR